MKRIGIVIFFSVMFFGSDVPAQRNRLISDIQGPGNYSPYAGEVARVSGIVTARVRNGFFLQTPDGKVDEDPRTSEGIFVFTRTEPGGEATVGNFVSITGRIDEWAPSSDQNSLRITQIAMDRTRDFVAVESKGNALPKPILLTVEDFKPGSIDQLEKYEAMRVTVGELSVVAPTNGRIDEATGAAESDGTFFAVLKGFPRPFREPGFNIYDFLMLGDKEQAKLKKEQPKMVRFDHNPERLLISSSAQLGARPIDVATASEIKDLTGVMYYGYRTYMLMVDPDSRHTVSGGTAALALPAPKENQFSIAAMNVERLMDDEDDPDVKEPIISPEGFARRSKKISAAIRLYLNTPDVVAVVEAENLNILKKLSDRINKDAEAAGKPNPQYEAYLVEGNDPGGIDSGFLVRRARVDVLETRQFGKDDKFKNPVTKGEVALNDRPPFLLRAAIKTAAAPYEFTVIVNHMKSFRGYNDPKDAPFVQMKKKLQAEFLARAVDARQKANPEERIALVGDFNFYQFNDGIMDPIGTIRGAPADKETVITTSDDLLTPDLVNLVDLIRAEQRYSYVFEGNAQVLDHFIINEAFRKSIGGFGFARLNADYPETFRNDPNRVERFSDHDAALAVFTLP
jgi:hypothetical protein